MCNFYLGVRGPLNSRAWSPRREQISGSRCPMGHMIKSAASKKKAYLMKSVFGFTVMLYYRQDQILGSSSPIWHWYLKIHSKQKKTAYNMKSVFEFTAVNVLRDPGVQRTINFQFTLNPQWALLQKKGHIWWNPRWNLWTGSNPRILESNGP